MTDEVELRAPGFNALVRGRHVALLPPGRVNGGTAQLHNQFVFRGTRWGRPRTDVRGLYLCVDLCAPRRRRPRRGRLERRALRASRQAAFDAASRRRARGFASLTISST